MNHKKCDKSVRSKIAPKVDSAFHYDNETFLCHNHQKSYIKTHSKPYTEVSTKILTKDSSFNKDAKSKQCVKMSVKMNSYIDGLPFDGISMKCLTAANAASNGDKTGNCKLEKHCSAKICSSCKSNGTKRVYKSHKTQLQVSVRCRKSLNCKGDDFEFDDDSDRSSSRNVRCNKCSACQESKPDFLLRFLDHMRNVAAKRRLDVEYLQKISERLIQDNKNVELLLLLDLIIRFQIHELKDIIFKDLLSSNISRETFVKAFLKQYCYLLALSQAYSQIMAAYEAQFMAPHSLSFDLISRAHFKINLYDNCREIQELIDFGHFNIEEELVVDFDIPDCDPDRVRSCLIEMKNDFQTTERWDEVQRKIESILHDSNEISRSLLRFFNANFSTTFQSRSHCSKECCETIQNDPIDKSVKQSKSSVHHYHHNHHNNYNSNVSCTNNSNNTDCVLSPHLTTVIAGSHNNTPVCELTKEEYGQQSDQSVPTVKVKTASPTSSSSSAKMNYKSIYQTLANVKPPSLSSSSSTNSNDYNSCASTSSLDDSTGEEDDDIDEKDNSQFFSNKLKCDPAVILEETKPPTPVSLHDDDDDDELDDDYKCNVAHLRGKKYVFNEHEPIDDLSQDDIRKFNELYHTYLEENRNLWLNPLPASQMSVPDCIRDLESADNLQSLLSVLMTKCTKSIKIHESTSPQAVVNLTKTDSDINLDISSTCFDNKKCDTTSNDTYSFDSLDCDQKSDDFDMDFEEFARTFSNSTIRENLKEFEKYLGKSFEDKKRPNLRALVKKCRIYCNKLCKKGSSKDDNSKFTDSIDSSSDGGKYTCSESTRCATKKDSVSGDESFELPDDCGSIINQDNASNGDNCSTNPTSLNNNLSSSDTCSNSGAGNDSSNNNKVCKCCKCEMFGDQTIFGSSKTAVERLRLKFQKRKMCQQKNQSNKLQTQSTSNKIARSIKREENLPDVDTLVKFINGDVESQENRPQTPEISRNVSKKSKSKSKTDKSKNNSKTKQPIITPDEMQKSNLSNPNKIVVKKPPKQFSSPSTDRNIRVCNGLSHKSNGLDEQKSDKKHHVLTDKSLNEVNMSMSENGRHETCEKADAVNEDDKDQYDPVVEDFKRFCDTMLVVPSNRKKLSIDPSVLIRELQKCQVSPDDNNNSKNSCSKLVDN